ncbi:MAG: sigma-70 family RNA polymerase sigma factor [Deltaproteobacteria bacterium]|nr:sigma-70 family RNA polymerase sigma factor [Deltaproteobacteria bacterium]
MTPAELTEEIRRHLAPGVRAACGDALAARIEVGMAAIAQQWPHGPAPGAELAAYAAERIARQDDLASALPRLRLDDLYLAWWACRGDDRGIAAFEAAYAADLSRLVQRFHRLSAEELRQGLRIKLFVGGGDSPPQLHKYGGFGFLQNWLKVTAARTFLDAARTERGRRIEAELDDDLLEVAVLGGSNDPRERHESAQVNAAVKRAFAAAVAALVPRERTFLRHAMVDHLTLEQIAATYQVHRTTVARTLASARARLLEQTRAGVVADLGITPDRIDSAIHALDSKIDLSLSRVLRDPPSAP